MINIKLTLITALKDGALAGSLRSVSFPDGIEGKAESLPDGAELSGGISFPEDGATLLITDCADLLSLVKKNVYIVFIGSLRRETDKSSVSDIWPEGEPADMYIFRCGKQLEAIRDKLLYEFYRTALVTTIDTVPDMLWYKRLDGIHMLVNDAFTGIVHKPKSDVIGKDHFYIWDAPRPAEGNNFACAESEEIAISTGKMYIGDEPVKTREGMKQFITYKTPLYDPFGNVFGTVGVGHDVTNFSNLGIELSILIENMPFPMTIFSPEWSVVRMNSAFREITGAQEGESFNYKLWKLTVPIPVGTRYEDRNRHIASTEYRIDSPSGIKNIMLTELEIRDYFDNISGYFCTMQDITYQRSYEDSIIRTANTDMLTGMYNRRYFYSYMNKCIGSRFHLLYLDLDNFKAINDSYGHSAGDEVLIKTAEIIKQYFPHAVSARLGGDEFAVIDENEDSETIKTKCRQLKKSIADEFAHYKCNTGVSVGTVFSDGSVKDIDAIIHMSDEEMYVEKKKHHKDCC